jgi:hypothetical protein
VSSSDGTHVFGWRDFVISRNAISENPISFPPSTQLLSPGQISVRLASAQLVGADDPLFLFGTHHTHMSIEKHVLRDPAVRTLCCK